MCKIPALKNKNKKSLEKIKREGHKVEERSFCCCCFVFCGIGD
jgi:hypothetical protein